eukprot:10308110-Heterocapsa_arctica.AAC.1
MSCICSRLAPCTRSQAAHVLPGWPPASRSPSCGSRPRRTPGSEADVPDQGGRGSSSHARRSLVDFVAASEE